MFRKIFRTQWWHSWHWMKILQLEKSSKTVSMHSSWMVHVLLTFTKLCVWESVYVPVCIVCVYMYGYTIAHGMQRSITEHRWDRLLTSPSECTGFTPNVALWLLACATTPGFLHGSWGFEFSPSCLRSKFFIHLTIPPNSQN